MWKSVLSPLALVICILLLAPASGWSQDRVSELEKKVQDLEKQLQDMKQILEAEKAAREAAPPAAAPPAAPPTAPPTAPPEKPVTKLIGPGGTLQVGGDIRLRGLYFDNLWDFEDGTNDRREVYRFRPRVFLDWNPTDTMEAYVRFTKEWFYGQDNEHFGYDVEAKDAMFDNAWAEVRDILGTGLTLRAGRQDLVYGEGFVILDGTPYDGSQTISFDAAKLSYKSDWGTTDLIYSKLQENGFQSSDDEDLYGIYNKFTIGDTGVGLEPYFLVRNKNDAPDISGGPGKVTYPYAAYDPSPKEQTYLLGMRGTKSFAVADGMTLALASEFGKEFGEVDFTGVPKIGVDPVNGFSYGGSGEVDRDAWGGYLHATLTWDKTPWKPSLKAGFYYMSGDDPTSDDYEGWDDFYGQWPKYSELYIYSLYDGFKFANKGNDPDVGAWSNIYFPELMFTFQPTDKLTQSFRYLYYLAEEKTGPGGGDERGHNIQSLTNYVFTKNMSGHILVEWLEPGNYYADDADGALFARFQLMYTF